MDAIKINDSWVIDGCMTVKLKQVANTFCFDSSFCTKRRYENGFGSCKCKLVDFRLNHTIKDWSKIERIYFSAGKVLPLLEEGCD